MKNSRLYSVLTVSIALLACGCHHKPSGITPIPDNMQPPQNQEGPPGGTLSNPEGPSASNVGIPLGNGPYTGLFNGPHNEDRDKFRDDTVHFAFDSAVVQPGDEGKLQDVANYFKSNSSDALIVEGHCDERGTEKYNLSLGERRALAVREYLANLGMDPQRIKTMTYGFSRPVDPAHNEAAWKKNRRAEMVLVTPK